MMWWVLGTPTFAFVQFESSCRAPILIHERASIGECMCAPGTAGYAGYRGHARIPACEPERGCGLDVLAPDSGM